MNKLLLLLLLTSSIVFSAEKAFIPWSTGPYLAASGNNQPQNTMSIQPMFSVLDDYGAYNDDYKLHGVPSIFMFYPSALIAFGLFNRIDLTVYVNSAYLSREHRHSWTWGDTKARLGFQIYKADEDSICPSIRFFVSKSFPTGKYRNLDPEKIATQINGEGAYSTNSGFAISNTSYVMPKHPLSYYFNFIYHWTGRSQLKGFNGFGGGYGTDGSLKPGDYFWIGAAFELSLTQRWVVASDFFLTYSFKSKDFRGFPGLNADGTEALNFYPTSNNFSITPTIEYNFSPDFGLLFGIWASLFGRNSGAFAGGFFSLVYSY